MSGFEQIIGHEDTVKHLKNAIGQGKVSHAYIVQGPSGSGKRMIADIFARTLQCEEGGTEPCGKCHSCKQALSLNHPDIIYVQHEKPAIISVAEIRQQLVSDVQVRPYNGRKKVYIIEDADKMNTQAQNALLKTLEEPPEYAVILLLTANAQALLDTIRSRCVMLNLRPVSDEAVEKYLREVVQVPDYQAKLCTSFAQGSIGRAVALASSEDFNEIRNTAVMLVRRAPSMDITELTAMVKSVSAFKLNVEDFLDILSVWYRDVLYFKATNDAGSIVFADQLALIRNTSQKSSYEGLQVILSALEKAGKRLKANVNFDLTMELLFLTIKEN